MVLTKMNKIQIFLSQGEDSPEMLLAEGERLTYKQFIALQSGNYYNKPEKK